MFIANVGGSVLLLKGLVIVALFLAPNSQGGSKERAAPLYFAGPWVTRNSQLEGGGLAGGQPLNATGPNPLLVLDRQIGRGRGK